MPELMVDFITSLDGYASGEGWPGFWGLQGPEYLAWLEEQPEVTYLMGANTYRLMSGFAAGETPAGQDEFTADEIRSVTAPTFLVIGDRDFVRLDHAAEMLDLFPDCRLAVLPATRHTEVMQRSDELRALVDPFLS